jgi:glucan phosphoethanolaminetransferase (alkaline phosphatase superfamily)
LLLPGPSPWIAAIDNPFGVEGLKDIYNLVDASLEALSYGVFGVPGVVSLYFRFRRAGRVERQQIKWFAYAGAVLLSGVILLYAGPDSLNGLWIRQVGFALWVIGFVCVPTAIGIAIFKYRLYEIDLLINRTLVYGSLTATLVALYFGAVVLSQRVFVLLTGQQSTLAAVASTLAIAALFNPLRRLIQSFVDRRFYRRKYDARETLEAFSAKLRDQTDLAALSDDLVWVVGETMQPAHVSLWLRPDVGAREQGGGSREPRG